MSRQPVGDGNSESGNRPGERGGRRHDPRTVARVASLRRRPWTVRRVIGGMRKHAPAALGDAVAVALAYQAAILLRYDGVVPSDQATLLLASFPVVVLIYVGANLITGIYWRAWQYGGLMDALALVKSAAWAFAVLLIADVTVGIALHRRPVPLTVAAAGAAFGVLGMGALKLAPRIRRRLRQAASGERRERLLIVGAGEAGQWLVRELQSSARHSYLPVCFVDDDPGKGRMQIHGVPVVGTREDIPAAVEQFWIDVVAVAIPSAEGHVVREIVSICQRTNAKVRIVPGVGELLDGNRLPLREVTVEDLLGRAPVSVDLAACSAYIAERVVLLTGAAGSIGSELARQVAGLRPARMVLLDTNESGLHDLTLQLRAATGGVAEIVPVVGSVERREIVRRVFERYHPAVVFHAAAYKHVPLMEEYPEQAILVNVAGTRNVCAAAREFGAERFVLISTDKAVKPANVMGATKRLCEEIVRAFRQGNASALHTVPGSGATGAAHAAGVGAPPGSPSPRPVLFAAVRFGNVLESRGSVIPTFKWQIERGGPVTVTHPHIRRYFMTIPEAVSLVLQAGAYAGGNDLFLLDMGEEMSISDLAEKMILMRGLRPGKDIQIVYTGLRPGEKLREELVIEHELLLPTPHPKINRVVHESALPLPALLQHVARLEALAHDGDPKPLREALFDVVRQCDATRADSRETGANGGVGAPGPMGAPGGEALAVS